MQTVGSEKIAKFQMIWRDTYEHGNRNQQFFP